MNFDTNSNVTVFQNPNLWRSSKVTTLSLILIVAATLPYFIFSSSESLGSRSWFFKVSTYIFTDIALFLSAFLCYRNWQQPRTPSGQKVWLLFGLAVTSYLIGEIIMSIWELHWGLLPNGTPADLAFAGFYLLTIAGVGMVISQQRVTLTWQQSILLFSVSAVATTVALSLTNGFSSAASVLNHHSPGNLWYEQIDQYFKPLTNIFNIFYILADMVLIILATILSLGFWGGRLGKTWQVVAQGIGCLYIADLRFAFLTQTTGYESGDLMEIFWIMGMLQIGIAAAIEWENGNHFERLLRRQTRIH